jgi:hypothetical protein
VTKVVEFDQFFLHDIEIPPDPPFSKGGMFCCFRKLAGMRSFPACHPKIASEYLPLYQTPNTSPLCQAPNTSPLCQALNTLPLYQRGPGGFNDRPKKTPNTSSLCQAPNTSPLCQAPNTSPLCQALNTLPLYQRGPGGFSQSARVTNHASIPPRTQTPRPRPAPDHDRRRASSLVAGARQADRAGSVL